MLFVDTKPSWKSLLLILLLVPVMYLLWLGVPRIRLTDEALTAAFAQDFISGSGAFATRISTRIYGQQVPGFPLYSWCVALCSGFGMPSSFTLRLPSVLALFGTAVFSAFFAKMIHKSLFAGIIAIAVVLTSLISFRVGSRAHNDVLCSMLLSGAWYWLYSCGMMGEGARVKWRAWLAWAVALLLVFIACFAAGAKALIIFYMPLLFTGQRLKILDFMQKTPHIVMAIVLLAALSLWIWKVPGQVFLPWNVPNYLADAGSETGFWACIFGFFVRAIGVFFKLLIYMFPWTMLLWAPFCIAQRQFERDKHACRYLRSIVGTNLVMFMLMPGGSPLHLVPVLGPIAVLIGVHAEIVLRRYQEFWGRFLTFIAWVLLLLAIFSVFFWSLVCYGTVVISGFSQFTAQFNLLASSIAFIILTVHLLFDAWRMSFRSRLLWIIFSFVVLYKCDCMTLEHWAWQEKQMNGMTLAGTPPEEASVAASEMFSAFRPVRLGGQENQDDVDVVYLHLLSQADFQHTLVETFYLRKRICHIRDLSLELPPNAETVFVLSPYLPADVRRDWTSLSPVVRLDEERFFTWSTRWKDPDFKADGNAEVLLSMEKRKVKNALPFAELRLYKGKLKKTEVK